VGIVSKNGQLLVTFAPPAFDGGTPITSYRATASPGGQSVTGTTSPLLLTNLRNGTPYT